MIHVTCDQCGKSIEDSKNHYRVEIEIFAMEQNSPMVEEDLDQDNLEHIAMLISDPDTIEPLPKINAQSGYSSAWLERLVRDQEVAGSNSVTPTLSQCQF